jgi:hypothetical protein
MEAVYPLPPDHNNKGTLKHRFQAVFAQFSGGRVQLEDSEANAVF